MPYFIKERRHGTRNFILGRLQPDVGKNSKDLAILILLNSTGSKSNSSNSIDSDVESSMCRTECINYFIN